MTSSELPDKTFNISDEQMSLTIMQQIAEMIKSEIVEVMHQEILPAIRHEAEGIIEETIRQYNSPDGRKEQSKKVSEMVRQGVDIKEEGRIGTLQIGVPVGYQQKQTESTYRGSMVSENKQDSQEAKKERGAGK